MNFVKIPNAFIDEQKIKENEYFLLVMALIERNRTIRGEIVFTNDYLFELLGIKKNDTRARKKIIEAVSYLLNNNNIVTSYHEMGNMIFVTTNEVKDNFFMVYDDEVNTILDSKDVKKYKLFNVFCCIKRSINNENKITFIGQEKLVELTGYSSSTIVEMKKLLKDIGLLNIDNAGAVVVKTIQGKNKIINASDYMSCKTDDTTGEILKEKVKLEKTKLANEYGKVLNKTKGNSRVVLETNSEQKKRKIPYKWEKQQFAR
ncbi:hypothetical protein [Thermobrachium celere]|uniref:hypothetical protein n=1 Tax=Thermobrachium celere TaxID=53422 RepID=UPI001942E6F1|nr:hypothetical protein [Thermobrachium celere]GFR35357.1 hypothetical protein TCEA9_11690 [Thermobrachium celere]